MRKASKLHGEETTIECVDMSHLVPLSADLEISLVEKPTEHVVTIPAQMRKINFKLVGDRNNGI